MKPVCCFAIALGLPLVALGAQERPALAAGARVRVIAPKPVCTYPEAPPCYHKVVGLLQSIDSTTIVVRRENGETVSVSRASSTRLDVSTGRGPCSGQRVGCVGLGFVGGAALGAVVGALSVHSQCGASNCSNTWVYVATVPAGAVVGMIVGAVVRGEDWERADLPAHLSVAPGGSGGLRLGLTLQL